MAAFDTVQSESGKYWIATTHNVVFRLNDNEFTSLTVNESLTRNRAMKIMEDHDGILWLGSRGTVCQYDPSSNKVISFTHENGAELINIWPIHEDRNGVIWLGEEFGLWRYFLIGQLHKRTDEFTNELYEDTNGNSWNISPNSSLSQYTPSTHDSDSVEQCEIYRGGNVLLSVW